MIGAVSKKAQMRPLQSIQETKMLRAEAALNRATKGPKRTYEHGVPHSARSANESLKYHAKLMTGRQSAAKTTGQLNPDRTLPSRRSFPGLVN